MMTLIGSVNVLSCPERFNKTGTTLKINLVTRSLEVQLLENWRPGHLGPALVPWAAAASDADDGGSAY